MAAFEEGGEGLDPSKSKRYWPGCWEPESVPPRKYPPSQGRQNWAKPSRSPLTNELLDPGEETARGLRLRGRERNQSTAGPGDCSGRRKHSPGGTFMLTWRCKISDLLRDSNPKSPRPDTTLIWSTRTNPNRAHLPRLRQEKTGCWMLRKASPKHQETAGRVTIPTRPLTT